MDSLIGRLASGGEPIDDVTEEEFLDLQGKLEDM